MSVHVHLDLVGGIAGDMFVAAVLDAFPDSLEICLSDLSDSGVLDHVQVRVEQGKSHGLRVNRFVVEVNKESSARQARYIDLKQFLENSQLRAPVKHRALQLLRLLAEAESKVHAVALDEVHFHEIADWDSVADVVAVSSVMESTLVDQWSCGVVPAGEGLIQTQHGKLPLPAPAALELMKGLRICDDGEAGERVTPTGAAILNYLGLTAAGTSGLQVDKPMGTLVFSGTGAGTRELKHRPNILRCTVIHSKAGIPGSGLQCDGMVSDEVNELRFAIDDMTPEELAVSLDKIRAVEGVIDVSSQLGMGKKSRVVFNVVVLCDPLQESYVSRVCFSQTSTLGIRVQHTSRRILIRDEQIVDDDQGTATVTARVKVASRPGHQSAKVASDDLQSLPTLEARRSTSHRLLSRVKFDT